jgi:hypothetical protein
MFTQYRTPEARCRLQFPDELASPHPSHCFCYSAREDANGCYGLQGQNGDTRAEGFSMRSCPASYVETLSRSSTLLSDLQSAITISVTGIGDGCVGFYSNVHGSPTFTGRSDLIMPPTNPSLLSRDAPGHQIASVDSMAIPMAQGNSLLVVNLRDQQTLDQTMPTEPPGFDSLDNTAMWNEELLSPTDNSFPVRHAGWYHLSPFVQ